MPVTKKTSTTEENIRIWHAAAACLGYNELVLYAESLEQKTYFRISRDEARKEVVRRGGTLDMSHDPPILEIPYPMPHIRFSELDIELMREAVKKYDEAKVASFSKEEP